MVKIPKNIPKWLPVMFEYVGEVEGVDQTCKSIYKLCERHWNTFMVENGDPPAPRKQKKKDPNQDLKKALTSYKEVLKDAKKTKKEKIMNNFKEQIRELPPDMKKALKSEFLGIPYTREQEETEDNEEGSNQQMEDTVEEEVTVWEQVDQEADTLYVNISSECEKLKLSKDHPKLVKSVDELYGITKRIIETIRE